MKMRNELRWANIKLDPSEHIDRKVYRFMGDGIGGAIPEAIEDSGLPEDHSLRMTVQVW